MAACLAPRRRQEALILPCSRTLPVAVFVPLPEPCPEVGFVSVARTVGRRVAAHAVPVIAMTDGIVTLAVTSIEEAEIMSGLVAGRACGVLIDAGRRRASPVRNVFRVTRRTG